MVPHRGTFPGLPHLRSSPGAEKHWISICIEAEKILKQGRIEGKEV